jgi:hypothetical protein
MRPLHVIVALLVVAAVVGLFLAPAPSEPVDIQQMTDEEFAEYVDHDPDLRRLRDYLHEIGPGPGPVAPTPYVDGEYLDDYPYYGDDPSGSGYDEYGDLPSAGPG